MKTDDLIAMLATGDPRPTTPPPPRAVAIAWLAAAAVAALAMWRLLGLNPYLAADIATGGFWLKLGFAGTLVAASLRWVVRLGQPGRPEGAAPRWLAASFGVIWALGAVALLTAAPELRTSLLLGDSWRSCPWLIAGLSVPVLVAGFVSMRMQAPTRPVRAGAAIGLLSGGTGMLVYVWHCPEPAIPFVAVWYALGALIPAAVGAWLGSHLLRW